MIDHLFSSQPAWWPRARAQGLVHGEAPEVSADEEPNVFIIALAMVGALVCTIAAGGFLVMLFDFRFWERNPLAYLVSVAGLVGAGVMLNRKQSVFLACLSLVLWGVFSALLFIRLANDIHSDKSAILLFSGLIAALQLVGAAITRAQWIRRIMGVVFAMALYVFIMRCFANVLLLYFLDIAGVLMAGFWIYWLHKEPEWLQQLKARPALAGWTAFIDSAMVGLLFMLVSGFVGALGLGTSLNYALMELYGADDVRESSLRLFYLISRAWAVLLVLVATALIFVRWKSAQMASRQTLVTVLWVGVLLAIAAWFSPSLGVISLLAAGALIGGRWRIAMLCGLAALWALAMFYYSLAWPLAQKGLGLALLGAALLAGLYVQRQVMSKAKSAEGTDSSSEGLPHIAAWSRNRLVLLIAGALLVFGLVNWDVRGKEQVIANGQPVLVPLVPVDPRSLMQGDYMALRFDLPPAVRERLEKLEESLAATALVRARLNDKGVATVIGLATSGADLQSGEVLLPLKRLKGQWVLVTDAYFFPEGTGRVFERASYGDFRVLPDGRALLVGLADSDGAPIPVPKSIPKELLVNRDEANFPEDAAQAVSPESVAADAAAKAAAQAAADAAEAVRAAASSEPR